MFSSDSVSECATTNAELLTRLQLPPATVRVITRSARLRSTRTAPLEGVGTSQLVLQMIILFVTKFVFQGARDGLVVSSVEVSSSE